jgi:hypothetical protein
MIRRLEIPLVVAIAALLLTVSCASTDYARQVENLGRVGDGTKAYLMVKIDNQSGKALFAARGKPTVWLDRALTDSEIELAVKPRDDSPYVAYEVKPGTYRLVGFSVYKDGLLASLSTTTSYRLDPHFLTFFKVNAGEIVYLGTYTMVDKEDGLIVDYDPPKVKDEVVEKYPQLEGFRWVGLLEDRPSF